jgi:hypothetical protein
VSGVSTLKYSFVLIIFLIFASQFFRPITFAEVSQNQAASALDNAEAAVTSSYQAVLKAQESGANVSSLLAQLNEAGWFLARAHVAYKSGDFDSALKFATQSQQELNGFVDDADALRNTATQEYYWGFMVNVVGPIIGAIGIICCSFIVWFLLKRRYEKAGSMV